MFLHNASIVCRKTQIRHCKEEDTLKHLNVSKSIKLHIYLFVTSKHFLEDKDREQVFGELLETGGERAKTRHLIN